MPPSHLSLLGAESIAEPAAELADGFYRRLVESVTDYAIYRLADGLRVTGQTAQALDMYRTYLGRVPGDAEAEARIAELSKS